MANAKKRNAVADLLAPDEPEEAYVQLATRIPKALHKRLKLFCVQKGVSVMSVVQTSIDDVLSRATSTAKRA